jgi:hypothetical protein
VILNVNKRHARGKKQQAGNHDRDEKEIQLKVWL